MKKSVLIAAAAVSLFALAACGQKSSGTASSSSSTAKAEKITVAGSTALQPLVEANVESFTQENTNLQITVQGVAQVLVYHKSLVARFRLGILTFSRKKKMRA